VQCVVATIIISGYHSVSNTQKHLNSIRSLKHVQLQCSSWAYKNAMRVRSFKSLMIKKLLRKLSVNIPVKPAPVSMSKP
jgi:hypothetical protein